MANDKCQKFRVGQTVRHRLYDAQMGPAEVLGYSVNEKGYRLVSVRQPCGFVGHVFEENLRHDYVRPHGTQTNLGMQEVQDDQLPLG